MQDEGEACAHPDLPSPLGPAYFQESLSQGQRWKRLACENVLTRLPAHPLDRCINRVWLSVWALVYTVHTPLSALVRSSLSYVGVRISLNEICVDQLFIMYLFIFFKCAAE